MKESKKEKIHKKNYGFYEIKEIKKKKESISPFEIIENLNEIHEIKYLTEDTKTNSLKAEYNKNNLKNKIIMNHPLEIKKENQNNGDFDQDNFGIIDSSSLEEKKLKLSHKKENIKNINLANKESYDLNTNDYKKLKESKISEMGQKRFKEIFTIKDILKNEIEIYKSQKTWIYLEFFDFSHSKYKYEKIKFESIEKEILIGDKKIHSFEYIDNKYPYLSEITENIILIKENIKHNFLITIKKHHKNYYKVFTNVENEKTFSLEIIFYIKDKNNNNIKYIEINKNKIYTKEKFAKTQRYNLININLENSIKIFNKYSNDKISEDKNEINEAFNSFNSLVYDFIYGNKKKIGKIFEIELMEKIEELDKNEKSILKEINELIVNSFDLFNLRYEFDIIKKKYNYEKIFTDNGIEYKNYLNDINNKFNRTPYYLKYFESEPSNDDIEEIRALCFLNILLEKDSMEWFTLTQDFLEETKNIFENHEYLSNKDKIMIMLNYLIAIKNDELVGEDYIFKSFYKLNENSSYIQSELMYRKIISNLDIDSKLFFLYLQLNSGAGYDYITGNYFYRIKHISLIEIKTHLLEDYFYPYFFIFTGDKKVMAWNCGKSQVKNYNKIIISNKKFLDFKFFYNDSVKLVILKFHENGHIKYKRFLINQLQDIFIKII